ncbi:hypothetical protein TVAGG3_0297920 [Trichomonas vaginalis G3]|uniref:hypothetical protein n=1 Tax=Trichomonas vaginalis (strain ATCC PRA-98 / G3) TaxID=412133 RepID=UPI0021E60A0E|nr:hypothetical protein TVAGG3_0297920 [Trichomonas vaginalis G3]KAI5527725.1 hypothetical protein TVAGG3_0297920 [Trichomonas vaginalis G3]
MLWDCESGLTLGITRQVSEAQYVSELQWSRKIVLGFAEPNTIYSIDFWPYEAEDQAKNSRILWKIDVPGTYTRMAVNSSDIFTAILYSNGPSFTIITSKNAKQAPTSQSQSHTLDKSEKIVEIQHHPHISNILLIMLEGKILTFNIATKSGRNLVIDESSQSSFHKLLPSLTNDNEITVYGQDSSLSIYICNEDYILQNQNNKMKRELFLKIEVFTLSAACNRALPERYIRLLSIKWLSYVCHKRYIPYVIAQSQIIPQIPTCYDFYEILASALQPER